MTHSLKCFLIDDDIDDQKIFALITEEIDHTIDCSFAKDGVDALNKLKGLYVPDVIFLDVNMPRMDGIECLERIKSIEHLRRVPVYMYSTTADPSTVVITKELGAKEFIVKPADINVLASLLTDIFNRVKERARSLK